MFGGTNAGISVALITKDTSKVPLAPVITTEVVVKLTCVISAPVTVEPVKLTNPNTPPV